MGFAAIRIDVEGENHKLADTYYYEMTLSPEEIKKATTLQIVFESIFFIDMISNFFTEYQPNDSIKPVRSIEKISLHYLNGQFIFDAIPIIPYTFLFSFKNCRLLYFVKSIRIFKSIELLSDKVFIN
jgi:hypothetical protein